VLDTHEKTRWLGVLLGPEDEAAEEVNDVGRDSVADMNP
jgi:hypothetical protein